MTRSQVQLFATRFERDRQKLNALGIVYSHAMTVHAKFHSMNGG